LLAEADGEIEKLKLGDIDGLPDSDTVGLTLGDWLKEADGLMLMLAE